MFSFSKGFNNILAGRYYIVRDPFEASSFIRADLFLVSLNATPIWCLTWKWDIYQVTFILSLNSNPFLQSIEWLNKFLLSFLAPQLLVLLFDFRNLSYACTTLNWQAHEGKCCTWLHWHCIGCLLLEILFLRS